MSLIINGSPKSATFFVSDLMRHHLKREDYRVARRGALKSLIMSINYFKFMFDQKLVAQQHICPTPYNLMILKKFPPLIFIHLVRDPKDCMVSWKYHITRSSNKSSAEVWKDISVNIKEIIAPFLKDFIELFLKDLFIVFTSFEK